jgi:GNAT superfamily N-acetyltransferase
MALELIRAKAEHIPRVARIMFDAFKGIHGHHQFPLDIPTLEVARQMTEMLVLRPDFYGVTALLDGKIVGSNFTQISDAVSGVGPISVDPHHQAGGVGRALMQHIVDWSVKNHGPMVRLLQDAFNMRSLSLYNSIGFTVVEPIILAEPKPAEHPDDSVRPLTIADLPACDALDRRVIKVSRNNELKFLIEHGKAPGFVPFGRFQSGKLAAYVTLGMIGHGVGESAEDLLTAAAQAARHVPPHVHRIFLPSRNGDLLRLALRMQFRCIKPMSLMAYGPYEAPMGPETGAAWTTSVAY